MAIAWPFGEYNQQLINISQRTGMVYHLVLDEAPARLKDLPRIRRTFVLNYENQRDFVDALRYREYREQQHRFIEISLDPFIGKSRKQQERILSALIRRIELLGVSAVVISPFSRNGRKAFFYNHRLPVATNILSRVCHQLDARNGVRIFLKLAHHPRLRVKERVYKDLARLNYFHGIIFAGKGSSRYRQRLMRIFRYYRPAVQFGITTDVLLTGINFRYQRQDAGISNSHFRQIIRLANKSPKPVYIALVDNTNNPGLLVKRMRMMRSIGVKHFGFIDQSYYQNLPKPIVVAPEMRQRSYARMGEQ